MRIAQAVLHALDSTLFVYSEGWMAASPLPATQRALKVNMPTVPGVAAFSDDLRDAIKGSFARHEEPRCIFPRCDDVFFEMECRTDFRRHTLLPLDDCLYALQATILHLSRSALHCYFQRHSISRLPLNEGGQSPPKKKFKDYAIGYLHVDFA